MAKRTPGKKVATLTHGDASRKNIPTAEYQAVMAADDCSPIEVAYERRSRDLDPQLVWRGKVQCIYLDPPCTACSGWTKTTSSSTTSPKTSSATAAHRTSPA